MYANNKSKNPRSSIFVLNMLHEKNSYHRLKSPQKDTQALKDKILLIYIM